MNEFNWSLQRLLDVEVSREQSVRNDLSAIAGAIILNRQSLARRLVELDNLLGKLGSENPRRRIDDEHVWMTCCPGTDHRCNFLQNESRHLESQREQKTVELMKIRQSRKKLDNIREGAKLEYLRWMRKQEQKQTDESAGIRFSHS